MATLDGRPQSAEVLWTAGDSLSITVTVPPEAVPDGALWQAELRASPGAAEVDEVFTVIAPGSPGDPAYLTLTAAQTRSLMAAGGTVVTRASAGGRAAVLTYTGVWDLQVSGPAGGDPVRTIIKGTLTLDQDVTRP